MKDLTPFDAETLLMMESVSGHKTKVNKGRTGFLVYMSIAGLDSAKKKAVAEALFRQCYVMVSDIEGEEQRIMRLMDVMYGRNLSERLAKLSEEYGELQEAAGKISIHGYMSDEDKVNVVNEASDMCAVLGHIVHILSFDFTEMLLRAEAKISGRIDNPDYMRRHPHTEDNN